MKNCRRHFIYKITPNCWHCQFIHSAGQICFGEQVNLSLLSGGIYGFESILKVKKYLNIVYLISTISLVPIKRLQHSFPSISSPFQRLSRKRRKILSLISLVAKPQLCWCYWQAADYSHHSLATLGNGEKGQHHVIGDLDMTSSYVLT